MSDRERVIKIEKSKVKDKKYAALLNTGRRVNFGYAPMGQFRDSTPLKLFSHKNHGDRKRQIRYLQRHHGGITKKSKALADEILKSRGKITPKWLSTFYLW
jgi:hypothetical protein